MSVARVGVVALARPTFDVPYAEAVARDAFANLDRLGVELVGPRTLLLDAAAAEEALSALGGETLDLLLILQVTFTDATVTARLAQAVTAPIMIWAFPEPRTGGRLRLNSLCGLNLAAHALGLRDRTPHHLHAPADDPRLGERIRAILIGVPPPSAPDPEPPSASPAGNPVDGARLGLIGRHPDGFDTCRFDAATLGERLAVTVDPIGLETLFERAREVGRGRIDALRRRAGDELEGLDAVDADATGRSLGLYAALRDLAAERRLDGLAVRCWPEMFTEHGCAVCRPMGMLDDDGLPCACEADVLGDVTSLLLQRIAGEPAWLVDLVDLDAETGVVWHCGLAPTAMADPRTRPRADIHSNRRLPLLAAFALRPGRVTLARISQARGRLQLVVAGGEAVEAPASFSGTSGTVRLDAPPTVVLDRIVGLGLEHHLSLVYGDHRTALRNVAAGLGLPVVTLA